MERCPWGSKEPLLIKYHDEEWGTPVHDDAKHFEFLLLETMQAGLSWLTVLKKREEFRKAFDNFDPVKISGYREGKINDLLNNAGIIRNRRKIEAAVNNAGIFLDISGKFESFDRYIWSFTDYKTIDNRVERTDQIPVFTELSDRVSKDLKKRGFLFAGSTTVYAHLQAIGIVNDHLITCFRYKQLSET